MPGSAPCQTPRVCSVSWWRVSLPSSSNRQSQAAVDSGENTAKLVDRPDHVAPSCWWWPGQTGARSSREVQLHVFVGTARLWTTVAQVRGPLVEPTERNPC